MIDLASLNTLQSKELNLSNFSANKEMCKLLVKMQWTQFKKPCAPTCSCKGSKSKAEQYYLFAETSLAFNSSPNLSYLDETKTFTGISFTFSRKTCKIDKS
uniref:(northern house mosquito) hypothetical protein n=1 Tax=Culex pipiens TaxID=7175 RepID=A0A8D8FBT0_CULPI